MVTIAYRKRRIAMTAIQSSFWGILVLLVLVGLSGVVWKDKISAFWFAFAVLLFLLLPYVINSEKFIHPKTAEGVDPISWLTRIFLRVRYQRMKSRAAECSEPEKVLKWIASLPFPWYGIFMEDAHNVYFGSALQKSFPSSDLLASNRCFCFKDWLAQGDDAGRLRCQLIALVTELNLPDSFGAMVNYYGLEAMEDRYGAALNAAENWDEVDKIYYGLRCYGDEAPELKSLANRAFMMHQTALLVPALVAKGIDSTNTVRLLYQHFSQP